MRLPNFLIIGAEKAGTAALYQILREEGITTVIRKIKQKLSRHKSQYPSSVD